MTAPLALFLLLIAAVAIVAGIAVIYAPAGLIAGGVACGLTARLMLAGERP